MTRAVLDTNVIVSAIISDKGAPRQLLEAWDKRAFELVTSPAVVAEVARALRYDRVKRRYQLSEEDIRAVIALLWTQGEVVPDPLEVQPLTADQADDLVLAVCLDGKADYLVTGDSVLLAFATHRSTRIVTPRAFLTTLEEDQGLT